MNNLLSRLILSLGLIAMSLTVALAENARDPALRGMLEELAGNANNGALTKRIVPQNQVVAQVSFAPLVKQVVCKYHKIKCGGLHKCNVCFEK